MAARDLFKPSPQPKTELGRYRILSSTAGVRVSPLVLGGMSFGTAWGAGMGNADEEQVFKILDAYNDAGGNFIDTANNYQNGQSETLIGKWMAKHENRDLMFIATKFTINYRAWDLGAGRTVNYSGNHRKSLHISVQESLHKLQTSYIDLLYVHLWDWTTSIEELMDSLHILVEKGQVLYLGISDTPAWVVSAANTYARAHGKTPFSVYQGKWNVMMRDFERDIIPMARHFGMALCPFGTLAAGKLQTKKQVEARKMAGDTLRPMYTAEQTELEQKASEALEKVAAEHGIESIQQIAIAYVMRKARNVFPIIGGRKVEQLEDNIKSLDIRLTDEQIHYLDAIKPFDIGFPMNVIEDDPRELGVTSRGHAVFAQIAWQKFPKPIGYV